MQMCYFCSAALLEHTAEQAEPEVLHLPTLEEAAAMACGVKSQDGSKELTQVFAQGNTQLPNLSKFSWIVQAFFISLFLDMLLFFHKS